MTELVAPTQASCLACDNKVITDVSLNLLFICKKLW